MQKVLQVLKYAGALLVLLLVVGLVYMAVLRGVWAARSRHTLTNVKAITQALEYFYQDQNRYPSILEFQDQNIMRQYLAGFPPVEFASGGCQKSFDYTNTYRDDYELRFCMPLGIKGNKTGWNVIKAPVK